MVLISREKAATIMTAENRGREFSPEPGEGIRAGRIVEVSFEDDGTECWVVEPFDKPGEAFVSRCQMNRERVASIAAKHLGVREDEIRLWLDA